jgi:NRAMP (natural resistance-associated macrophage protein)-like metal ion transporter
MPQPKKSRSKDSTGSRKIAEDITIEITREITVTEQFAMHVTKTGIADAEALGRHAHQELKDLGPGLITGAADDDPSGIATYAQTGAKFGLGLLWLMPFMLPLMVAVQESVGRIGIVTHKGLASNIKAHYSRRWLYVLVTCLLLANVINIGADIGAMADATKLLINAPFVVLIIAYAVVIVFLQIVIPYRRYSQVLKFLVLSLAAYFTSALIAAHGWGHILTSAFIPHWQNTPAYALMIAALFGTTISPYLFFWEPSQEVEEADEHHQKALLHANPARAKVILKLFRRDNFVGMFLAQLTAMMVVITAYSTLHVNGVFQVNDAATAAKLLEPLVNNSILSGAAVKAIFAIGIIGTGLLAIPTLAGSAAYAVSETLNLSEGLNKSFRKAKGFYIIIALTCVGGLLFNLLNIPSFKALFYAAVINAAMAIPLLIAIVKIGRDKKVMGNYSSGKLATSLCILTAVLMAITLLLSVVLN